MEGLRDSKLEEGQQWGPNTSLKDNSQWGRRNPFIGGEKIQPLSPFSARSGRYYRSRERYYCLRGRVVLPLKGAVLPLMRAGGDEILQAMKTFVKVSLIFFTVCLSSYELRIRTTAFRINLLFLELRYFFRDESSVIWQAIFLRVGKPENTKVNMVPHAPT